MSSLRKEQGYARAFFNGAAKKARLSNSGGRLVTVMQSTESRVGHDFQTDFSFHRVSSRRCVLHQSEMSAVLVVITNIFGEQSSQVPFVEGNHVIQEIAAATPYPALGDTVLPRATDRRSDGGESHGFYSALNLGTELRVMIEDQILLPVIVRKCFSQLLRHPTTGWVPGDAEVQNATAVMSDEEETIENSECDRWNREKIHGGNGFVMIVKKRFPASCRFRAARRSLNPTGNSALGKIEPSLSSSPWMRGAPQVGFSATMRKIKSRISLPIRFRPGATLAFDKSFQYRRKPARCQPTTVAGVTISRQSLQPAHRLLTATQNSRSSVFNRGRLFLRFKTASC